MNNYILLLITVLLWPVTAQADPISGILAATILGIKVSAILSTVATAIAGGVISYGVSKIGSLISKNSQPSVGQFMDKASRRSFMVRSSIDTHKVVYGQVRVSGTIIAASTASSANGPNSLLFLGIILASHEIEEVVEVYVNETKAQLVLGETTADGTPIYQVRNAYLNTGGTPRILLGWRLGADDQTAHPILSGIPGWSDDHRLQGRAHLAVYMIFDQQAFPNGIPEFSAVIKGKKVYDPRVGLTQYSNNWALCVRDYLSDSRHGVGALDDELDDEQIISAANVCDEDVTLIDGSTQKRYTCNGVVDTGDKPADILKDMAASAAGAIPYLQGKFKIYPGYYQTPVYTIDESWLAGDIEVVARPSRDEVFNAVKGVYVEPSKGWEPTDFPKVTNSLYVSQDGGDEIVRDIELAFVTDSERAQRIAKIILERSRQGITANIPCNMKAFALTAWDNVFISIDLLGWSSKVFKVIDWGLDDDGRVMLNVQEEASNSYDWNAGEATLYDPAPDSNLPDPSFVAPPGNPVITEEKYSTTNGSGVKVKATVTWVESETPFVQYYNLDYKLTTETEWTPVAGQIKNNRFVIPDIAAGAYNFRVIAYDYNNVQSAAAITNKTIIGLTDTPANITGFTLNAIGDNAHLEWDQSVDLDVRIGGTIEIRWTSTTSGATWSNSTPIGPALGGIATNAVVPLKTGTYFIKAVDSVGNKSASATSIVTNVADLINLNVVKTSNQHTTFGGTKTNMTVNGTVLEFDSTILFDDATGLFDDRTGLFDDEGDAGNQTSGTYIFTDGGNDYIDLGDVYNSRIWIEYEGTASDDSTTFDDATGLFDDRTGLFDGDDTAIIDVKHYIQTTDDDPTGSPTWSAWQLFHVGHYPNRAYKFKSEFTSPNSQFQIAVSKLAAHIDMPDRQERHLAESIAGAGTTVTWNKPFYAQPLINWNIQSASEGDTMTISHNTSGGLYVSATFQVLNGGGVARTVDIVATGY